MNPDLEVDVAAVTAVANDTAELAAQVSGGAEHPPALVTVPRWAAVDPAADATEAARRQAASIAADIAATADQIIASVIDYEDADERAASRMGAVA